MTVVMTELVEDLATESEDILQIVGPLGSSAWDLPTPAEGWSIKDQISHLAYWDERARLAATDPQGFREEAHELLKTYGEALPDAIALRYRGLTATESLEWFRNARSTLLAALRDVAPRERVPWYGPDMSAASLVSARIMETWAHGQDIVDALGVQREATRRLRHVAYLGVQTFGFSFSSHGLAIPSEFPRVELEAPTGELWAWGPENADDLVAGTALDFCLVVTQRRHLGDTRLRVSGEVAMRWMSIAQAFAGPPGGGRQAGQFSGTRR